MKEFLPQNVSKPIIAGRTSGTINLNGRSLTTVPRAVWDLDVQLDGDTGAWWAAEATRAIILSNNALSSLPDGLGQVGSLQTLNVSANELATLPGALAQLPALKILDVSSNAFQTLPDVVAAITSLAKVVVNDCPLTALPPSLGGPQQPCLNELHAARCMLTALPSSLAAATALRTLGLAGNRLRSVPSEVLAGLSAVTSLDLSENQLTDELPEGIGACVNLVCLNVRQNRLTALPPALGLCSSLVEIHAGHNALASLPDELGLCDALAVVAVNDNRLSTIGEGVPTLTTLRLFDLSNNSLERLPPALGHLTGLRALPIAGNPLRAIPRSAREGSTSVLLEHLRNREEGTAGARDGGAPVRGVGDAFSASADASALADAAARQLRLAAEAEEQAAATGVQLARNASAGAGRELDLADTGLREVPQEVWTAGYALGSLNLSNNAISSVPPRQLQSCSVLRDLNLARNDLSAWPLPGAPDSLGSLATLDLAFNRRLPCPPEEGFMSCAVRLKVLSLSGCPGAARDLSPLVICSRLETLHIDQCSLPVFPPPLLALPNLSTLGLGNNLLEDLPPAFTTILTKLTALDLRNNSLRTLPPALSLLPLKSLLVDGNILRTMRRGVLEQGTPALMDYLKHRLPA